FRRYRTLAGAAPQEARVGKQVALGMGARISAEYRLGAFKLVERNHRSVFSREPLVLVHDVAGVEGPFEELVDAGAPQGVPSILLVFARAQGQFISRHPAQLRDGVGAGKEPLPELLYQREPFGIGDDDLVAGLAARVEVADGCVGREPALFPLGPVATTDVLAQGIDLVLRLSEHDRKHELALRRVLEGVRRKAEVRELRRVQEVNNLSTVEGVAREPVGMPRQNSIGLAARDALEHFIEYGTAGRFRAARLVQQLDNLQAFLFGVPSQFSHLRFNREGLAVFLLTGFSAIYKRSTQIRVGLMVFDL